MVNTTLSAIIGGWGESRKIGFWTAFLISFLLSGLFGVIAVAISDPLEEKEQAHPKTGTADELIKFKSLLDSGAITQAEYDKQKTNLLK